MQNKPATLSLVSSPNLEEVSHYIDGWGVSFEGMGGTITTGRVFGYLLLVESPVSLDQMAADLHASKSSVSVAARVLEQAGIARRIPQRGSRRILYEAVESIDGMIESELQRRAMMTEQLRNGLALTRSGRARQRIEDFIALNELTNEQGRRMLAEWRDKRQGRG